MEGALADAIARVVVPRARSLRVIVSDTLTGRAVRDVDDDALVVDVAPGVVPDCEACSDRCCADPAGVTSLRLVDVARLVDAGLADAIGDPPDAEEQLDDEVHRALVDVATRDSFRLFPVLRKRGDGACVLLDERGRCSAYDVRPLACRAFPFQVDETLARVRFSNRCQSRRHDAAVEASERAVAEAVTSARAQAQDLVTIRHGHDALVDIGLARYLPSAR
jgi:Fe-S-cluster containining protein